MHEPPHDPGRDTLVVPLVAEALDIERERRTTGRVRITKRVEHVDAIVDEPLLQESVDIERHSIEREVSEPPPVRREGDTLIVPVLEEVLVVEKRLVLREELHIRRRRTEARDTRRVPLQREEVVVERIDEPPT